MPKREGKTRGRRLALTILLGIFVAIMLTIFVNLLVSYVYEGPKYETFCKQIAEPYLNKVTNCNNCTFSSTLQEQEQQCLNSGGMAVYGYNEHGCPTSVSKCDMCQKDFEDATKAYNRKTFFIYAIVGFALIVFGLFAAKLLLQIVSLPSGAFLVIEAATKNFDDKLFVIITFGLLIIAALYLAIKKLRLN